ncbi:tRNA pseudouridine(38-40) synthase TruA [Gammaproteobacteria bacterium]|nr:tRNA pseudouridine(38-40) synthase TruA [Gammaproteobacteria bacterium]
MSRETIALGLEYLGTAFHGFQSQRGPTTVQDVLEKALARVAGEAIRVTAAGRTDAGVHATHQVVSFTGPSRPLSAWVKGVNSVIGDDVAVIWAERAAEGFNARRSAARRRYMYVFGEADPRPAIGNDLAHWQTKVLDVERMEAAAQILIGEHDFSSFRAAQCQAPTPNRRIEKLSVSRNGRMVVIDTIANAFLMHMVRNIAGTLEQVGLKVLGIGEVATLLAARNRTLAAPTAPPHGLYLVQVTYPDFSRTIEVRRPVILGPQVID